MQDFTEKDYSTTGEAHLFFIDRDGVLIEEVGSILRREDVSFIPGLIEAIRFFNHLNIPVIITTNQAEIGKGYFDWDDFEEVLEEIEEALKKGNALGDAVMACPFHEEGVRKYRFENQPFKKPNPGMILFAAEQLGIVPERPWIVGDKLSDIEAALNACLYGAVHVETGHGREPKKEVLNLQKTRLKLFWLRIFLKLWVS